MNEDFSRCQNKQEYIKDLFKNCTNAEERYQKIIELGKDNPKLEETLKSDANLVNGCQSKLYLHSECKDGKIYFSYESDALISSGLAKLMTLVYSEETPETILKCPPKFLQELKIPASLSPSRSNGLSSLFLRMQQDALAVLTKKRG